ncbi:hypothetical protein PG985_008130 [Apiospora marii]|uniref:DUF7770 domain-containing protein n=1 Tax=Apiospora marii TaxID=335849 RepID=A0ABR1RAG0_9PEZI
MSSTILDSTNWDLEVSDDELQKAVVQRIHLCALRNEFNEGSDDQPPTNHWVICLETAPSSSIMLDMAPGYGEDGLRGKILVTAIRDRAYTDETLRNFPYELLDRDRQSPTTTAAEILRLIQARGRHKYTFSPEWEGCRYWISVVVDDLETEGIVGAGTAKEALEQLSQYWRCPDGSEAREMRKGGFA